MKPKLVLIILLVLITPAMVFAESTAAGIVIPIGSVLAALLIATIGAIARFLSGRSSFMKTVSDKFSNEYTQEEIDKIVEDSLKTKLSPALADVIGDIVSSVLKTHVNGNNLSVNGFVAAVIANLKQYSPNVLSKLFLGVSSEIFTAINKKEAFLSAVNISKPFVDAVHNAVHSM